MPLGLQDWVAAAIVLVVALALIRAQWKKSASQVKSSCQGCHKQSEIGKPKQAFRGIKINTANK